VIHSKRAFAHWNLWGGRRRSVDNTASRLIHVCLCLALSACAEFPEIAAMEGPPGPPPALQPLEGILPEPSTREDPAPDLAARAAVLRARAAAIGTP
jgi:hypothetical protein